MSPAGPDAGLFRAVNRLADRTSWAHGAAATYAQVGIVAFAALLVAGWWAARASADSDRMARVLWAGAGALAALGVNQAVAGLVHRARPYAALAGVHVLVPRTSDVSFPSDHAVVAGAVAAGLTMAWRRLGLVAAALALVMAAARVYVGAHYPADVIAGLALGAAVVVLGGVLGVPLLRAVVERVGRSRWNVLVRAGPRTPS